MSALYTTNLDPHRQVVFQKLATFSPEFVLAGGTAIMLQLNHRQSYDFDCFSSSPLQNTLLRQAKKVFGEKINVQIDSSDTLLFTTPENVEVAFVYYPYPPLHSLVETESIPLFNLADLAADKARTIGRRGMWRDYVDLFFFLKREVFNLDEIAREAEKRFAGEFSDKLFLEQLVYFDDLEMPPIAFLQETYAFEEIMDFLMKEVEAQAKKKFT